MNLHDAPGPFFTLGTAAFLTLTSLATIYLAMTLRYHIDEEKVRKEPSLADVFRSSIPPERILTSKGIRNVKIAKVALILAASTVALIIARLQFVQK
jgi:hypothetical protein